MRSLSIPRPPLASAIREARRAAGLTQQALAVRLGLAVSTVGRWEIGEAAPDVPGLTRLAKLLKTRFTIG